MEHGQDQAMDLDTATSTCVVSLAPCCAFLVRGCCCYGCHCCLLRLFSPLLLPCISDHRFYILSRYSQLARPLCMSAAREAG